MMDWLRQVSLSSGKRYFVLALTTLNVLVKITKDVPCTHKNISNKKDKTYLFIQLNVKHINLQNQVS
jgi:hypothetical protein